MTALAIAVGSLAWLGGMIALGALADALAGRSSEADDAEAFMNFDRDRDLR